MLGENSKKRNRNIALFITWAVMGLWHGANWTFIFWGVYHASFIYLERIISKYTNRFSFNSSVKTVLGWLIVIPIAMLAWVPFRAANMTVVLEMYSKLFSPKEYLRLGMQENTYIVCATLFLFTTFASLFKTFIYPKLQQHKFLGPTFTVVVYSFMIILVFTFLRPISQFIYFQF